LTGKSLTSRTDLDRRVGYDFTIGYLKGGFDAWREAHKEVDHVEQVSAAALAAIIETNPHANILDVRRHSEYMSEHLLDVKNIPLDFINNSMAEIDKSRKHYVHCAGGYRSMIFISILKARGFDNLVDIKGGFNAIKESGKFTLSAYVTPSTML
jgi:rhodanese-related sulfurtransferase